MSSNRVPEYSSLSDPAGVERLGTELANAVRAKNPTRVLIWEGVEDRVLGHVVARELGVGIVRAMNASGVLDFDGSFGPEDRVVLVADAYRSELDLQAMHALVRRQLGEVVAVTALTDTPVLRAGAAPEHVVVLQPGDATGGADR